MGKTTNHDSLTFDRLMFKDAGMTQGPKGSLQLFGGEPPGG